MSGALSIEVVGGGAGLRRFIDLSGRLYQNDPHWVPGLRSAQFKLLAGKTAFFEHAEMALFLARREGRDVGRIAAIRNLGHEERYKDGVGFFGFFECETQDAEAAGKLFDAAEAWLRERGLGVMRGPVNPSMNGECGLLVEGFGMPPMALMPYNPAAYAGLFEGAGFVKCKDLYAYLLDVKAYVPGTPAGERLLRLQAALARRHPEVTVRTIDMRRYEEEVGKLMGVFETARRGNWGYVPVTENERRQTAQELRRIIDPEIVLLAEVAGRPAGALMGIPNINVPLKAVGGRLFPFGFLRFFRELKEVREIRVIGIAALKEDRAKGITGLLFLHLLQGLVRRGYERVEASWVLEDNVRSNLAIEGLEAERYKVYRVYERGVGGRD